MLNEDEVAALESLIRRMTDKQRWGLEEWLNALYDRRDGTEHKGSLWQFVKEAQEYVPWYEMAYWDEVAPGEPWGTPEDRRPHLTLVK